MTGSTAVTYSRDQARALPIPFDDLSLDFGPEIYEQMALDPQVSSCLTIFKASIIEDGAHLTSPVEDQESADYDLSFEIRNAAERMLKRMLTPLDDVLWAMLDGVFLGNKIAEIVCRPEKPDGTRAPDSAGPSAAQTNLNVVAIKPKPRQTVQFVVDAYMNIIGFVGAKPGQANPAMTGGPFLRPRAEDVIARDKFAVFTFRPVDCDPRGTSILRAAYEPWWRKRQMGPEYLRYLSQFAGPSIWATAPEEITAAPSTDGLGNLTMSDGTVVDDPDDLTSEEDDDLSDLELSPVQKLLSALADFRNGTVAAFPFGTMLHAIEMQGDGTPFLRCFAEADQQIVKAVLTQTLATEEGQNMARAAASVHQDVLDTLIRQSKKAVVRMLENDVLLPWVERNWGPEKRDLCPVVTLGTTETHDLPVLMTAIAALMRSNFIHPSQFPYYDGLVSAPVRDLTVAPLIPQLPGAPAPGEPDNAGDEAGTGGGQPDQGPRQRPADRARTRPRGGP